MTPASFMHQITTVRARWDALISAIPTADLENGQLENGWSLKALIAHITWYEQEMVDLLQTRVFAGSPLWGLPLDERNEQLRAAADLQPLQELLTKSAAVHAAFVALAQQLSAADLLQASHFRNMPVDIVPGELIAENAFAHYADHLPQLAALAADSRSV